MVGFWVRDNWLLLKRLRQIFRFRQRTMLRTLPKMLNLPKAACSTTEGELKTYMQKRLFGLIGYPLGHSFSAKYFAEKFERDGIFDAEYRLFSLESISSLPQLLRDYPNLVGLNVTIPHKKAILPYLKNLTNEAKSIGAVNCISVTSGGLIGTNTDAYGFEVSLKNWLIDKPTPQYALVLGTGGAAAAARYILEKMDLPVSLVSRQPTGAQISYAAADQQLASRQYGLIVQATPLGTAPDVNILPPISVDKLSSRHFVYDLVYNPAQSLLLRKAAKQGAFTMNGLEMLHLQAEGAWKFWNEYAAGNEQ
jgi:shikimate dehydrogenase